MSAAIELSREWRHEADGDYEIVRTMVGTAVCERCGKDVPLISETCGWEEDGPGRWKHTDDGGLATGECCGLLYADWWEGCFVYDLEASDA